MHRVGFDALDARQLLGVGTELEECVGLGAARELGIGDLVAPGTEVRRLGDLQEEVGEADPAAVEERRLVDDIVTATERVERGRAGAPEHLRVRLAVPSPGVDRGDGPALVSEPGEVLLLVLGAAAGDHVELGVLAVRAPHEAGDRCALQVRQVLAGQEPHQVGRGDDRLSVDELHPRRLGPGRARRPVR